MFKQENIFKKAHIFWKHWTRANEAISRNDFFFTIVLFFAAYLGFFRVLACCFEVFDFPSFMILELGVSFKNKNFFI